MAKINGVNKSELLDSQVVEGNAFLLIREAENFLSKHLVIKSHFIEDKLARKDIPSYPPRAVREAMINAIVHRDYTSQGSSISLFMY